MDAGGGPVVGSITLDAVDVGDPVTLSNFDNTGVSGWRWDVVDTPEPSATLNPIPPPEFGSTRVLANDVEGHTVVVRLTTYLDVARTIVDAVDQKVIAVKFPPPFDWIIPGASQTVERDTIRGWAADVNRMLREMHAFMVGAASAPGSFTVLPAGQSEAVELNAAMNFHVAPRIRGTFRVDGLAYVARPKREIEVLDPIIITGEDAFINLPAQCVAPVDITGAIPAGPHQLNLRNRGVPGDVVEVINLGVAAETLFVSGNGRKIDGLPTYPMPTDDEKLKLRRLNNYNWESVI
jgi:hypothetical protein